MYAILRFAILVKRPPILIRVLIEYYYTKRNDDLKGATLSKQFLCVDNPDYFIHLALRVDVGIRLILSQSFWSDVNFLLILLPL